MKLRLAILGLAVCGLGNAETGRNAWLRYAPLDATTARQYASVVPGYLRILGTSQVELSARDEVFFGVRGMLGRELRNMATAPKDGAILLGTLPEIHATLASLTLPDKLDADGFWLKSATIGGAHYLVIAGGDERGVLYGSFALMRKIALGESLAALDEKQVPYAPVRWVDEWDNLNGTI